MTATQLKTSMRSDMIKHTKARFLIVRFESNRYYPAMRLDFQYLLEYATFVEIIPGHTFNKVGEFC